MPVIPITGFISSVSQCCPNTKVIALSAEHVDINCYALIGTGLAGYIDRTDPVENIVEAIRVTAYGGMWFSQLTIKEQPKLHFSEKLIQGVHLTDQELVILQMIVDGETNRGIAFALDISEKTVEKHLAALYKKLMITSRVQAAVWAVRNKLA
ncbi:MAG: response regulator transcription factor [Chloroflexi bacterium]|nr:response regulator transcription factor [Chloroflexota bacterium]